MTYLDNTLFKVARHNQRYMVLLVRTKVFADFCGGSPDPKRLPEFLSTAVGQVLAQRLNFPKIYKVPIQWDEEKITIYYKNHGIKEILEVLVFYWHKILGKQRHLRSEQEEPIEIPQTESKFVSDLSIYDTVMKFGIIKAVREKFPKLATEKSIIIKQSNEYKKCSRTFKRIRAMIEDIDKMAQEIQNAMTSPGHGG